MKDLSLKKIVLCSIALLSGLFLLIGLAFNVMFYDMGLGGAAGDAVNDTLKTKASGFTMLSFKLPEFLRVSVLTYVKEDFCKLFETLLGITSLLTLVLAIGAVALVAFVFFRGSRKNYAKKLTVVFVVGLIIATVHSVLAIVFTSVVQAEMEKFFKELADMTGGSADIVGSYKTNAFLSIIFQAVCLVVYIVCAKAIKEKETVVSAEKSEGTVKASAPKEDTVDRGAALKQLIQTELKIVELLTEYKGLYDAQVISTADYIDKKVKLLRYAEKKVKAGVSAILGKCSFDGVVDAEKEVVTVLKEYDKLLKTEVISDADFVEKKVALLSYVIN